MRAGRLLRTQAAAVVTAAALLCVYAAAARAADPVLAAAGDIACQSGSTTSTDACQQASTASLLEQLLPSAIAPLGDEQYNNGTLAEFNAPGAFNDTWGAAMRAPFNIPFHPVPGNHEYDQSSTAAGYFQYFGTAAGPSSGYYSYDLGQWHIVALNSDCDNNGCANHDSNDGVISTAEVNWLNSDLDAHAGQCTLAYWHHPLFSSGDIGGSSGVSGLWTALYAHHADLVLNGHEHHYERFAPQDPNGVATTAGIQEIVVGTGGHDITQNGFSNPPAANSAFRDNTHFGALLLTLHAHSYDWAFKATPSGSTVDSGSANCHDQPPLATTGPANPVGPTTATLAGSVDPQGQATTYHFEYGSTSSYGSSTTDASAGSTSGAQSRSANISGLSPSTTYHYRLVATNASGTTDGADQTLTTQPPPPSVATGQANPVGQTTATLNGTVDPHGLATSYHFDYGTDTNYGSSTADASAGSGSGSQPVSADVGGLSPSTTYHFRVVATNGSGTTYGADQTFTTGAAPASSQPGGPTQPPQTNPVGPPPPQPSFRLIPRRNMTMLLRHGVLIGLTCPGACSVRAALEGWARVKKSRRHGPLRLGRAQGKLSHAGKTTLVIRLSAAARRELRRLRVEIVVDVAVAGGKPARLAEPFSLSRAVRSVAAAFAPF